MSAKDGEAGFLSRWSRRKAEAARGEVLPDENEGVRSEIASEGRGTPADRGSDRSAGPGGALAGTASTSGAAPAAGVPPPASPAVQPPPLTLADVERLGRDSDFAPFVRNGVDPAVKNAALRKLFTDPHFNVMDGLDTYIDDYNKPDPIPPAMLRRLNQARGLGLFDEPAGDAGAAPVEHNAALSHAAPPADGAAVAQSAADAAPGARETPEAPEASAPGANVPGANLPEATVATSATSCDDDPDLRLQQDHGAGRDGAAPGARR